MAVVRILAVGDVVGEAAVSYLSDNLKKYASEIDADIIVVNGENASSPNGIDPDTAKNLFAAGADVITSGNHIWRKTVIRNYIDTEPRLIRPANFPPQSPGLGYTIAYAKGYRVLVANVLGTVYMESLSCPFETVRKILLREENKYDIAVLDFHAEATSEKIALASYFDNLIPSPKLAVVFGTHTHVQTSDARILKHGTGFITDIGMTGCDDSVLGIRCSDIIEKLKNKMPVKFEIADGQITAHGAAFEVDTDSGKCLKAEFISF